MIPSSYFPMVCTIYFAIWLVIAYQRGEKSPGYDPDSFCKDAGMILGVFTGFFMIMFLFI